MCVSQKGTSKRKKKRRRTIRVLEQVVLQVDPRAKVKVKQDAHSLQVEVPGNTVMYIYVCAAHYLIQSFSFSCGVHSKVNDDIDAVVREVNQQFGAASLQSANSECIPWSMLLHPLTSTI